MLMRCRTVLVRRSRVLFAFTVTTIVMMVGGLSMVMGSGFVMRSGLVVVLARGMCRFRHLVLVEFGMPPICRRRSRIARHRQVAPMSAIHPNGCCSVEVQPMCGRGTNAKAPTYNPDGSVIYLPALGAPGRPRS